MARCAILLVVTMGCLVAGCVLAPIDRDDRSCDALGRCIEGYVCQTASHRCVRALEEDAAVPQCEPGCHPRVEHCTVEGCALNEYVPGSRVPSGRAPRTVVLPPSVVGTSSGSIEVDFADLPEGLADLDVDALDVMLIPPNPRGGSYVVCRFHNLPVRPVDHPLVLASTGGPVRCEYGVIEGGSNWVLTGRYDAASGIGDPSAPGHDGGHAESRGRYGFEFLRNLAVFLAPEVTSPSFEIEHVEVSGRLASDNPQLQVLGDAGGDAENILIHDVYLHDAGLGGAMVLSNGGGGLVATALFRNRIVRAAGGCLSGRGLGDGTVIRNQVTAACNTGARALHAFEDAAVEIGARDGTIRFEENIVIGSRGRAVAFIDDGSAEWSAPAIFASDVVVQALGGYAVSHGPSFDDSTVHDAALTLRRWSFSGFTWRWDSITPEAMPREWLVDAFRLGVGRVDLLDVHWDAAAITVATPFDFDRTSAVRTGPAVVAPVVLTDFMDPSIDVLALEHWHAATVRPSAGPRTFDAGAVVTYLGDLYRATRATTESDVPGLADAWERLASPADDVRVLAGSSYAGLGIDR